MSYVLLLYACDFVCLRSSVSSSWYLWSTFDLCVVWTFVVPQNDEDRLYLSNCDIVLGNDIFMIYSH